MPNVVKISKWRHGYIPDGRPRTDECVSIVYSDGTGRRYEFDYGVDAIYVYCNTFDAFGRMTPNGYAPVRVIPRPRPA